MKFVKVGLMFSLALSTLTAFADQSSTIPQVGESYSYYAWGNNMQYGYSATIVSTSNMYIEAAYKKSTNKFSMNILRGTIQVQITNVNCPDAGYRRCLIDNATAQGDNELGVPDVGRVITIDAVVPYQMSMNKFYSSSNYSNFTDYPLDKKWAKITRKSFY